MKLCQEEELVWHPAMRICDQSGLGTPVYCDTIIFIVPVVIMVFEWTLKIMVWQERKQAVEI